ncbi:WD repeat-containing protein 70 isoform X1 [Manis pentadactyla]|uniref:WD repeat-containing protein 70 isoform X1 n=1 Tax=Manis pentadactyla TaxID=143292 RepID=UPI00255CE328|nr:WD repeat-containing protein 70 isoform X1 [Manis pentadactyla]
MPRQPARAALPRRPRFLHGRCLLGLRGDSNPRRRYFLSGLQRVSCSCLGGSVGSFARWLPAMERPGPSEGSDPSAPDPQLAVTMGFTGFGKKARTFDLEAMFEQTRRTAVERSRKTLEAREKEEEMNRDKELRRQNEDVEPTSSGSDVVRDCSKLSSRDTSSSESEESSDSSSDELIGPPLPLKTVEEPVNHMEEDIIGPLPPPLGEEEEDDDDGDSEEEENPVQKIPDSHEITLRHGTKTVSALGLDPSGARLVTGGYDYDVKFWDFAGMDASFKAFRSLQPCECHQIKSLQYSNTGDMILVVSGSSQAKVIDRDGFEVMECIKGDQYIVDMANTKGHTAMLHTGSWHPKIKGEFVTCSNDATVRTWEVENPKKQKSVFKPRTMQGKKVIPTTCTYSRDGNLIAAACQNGSIQIWDRNMTVHPKFHYKQAHDLGTDTSCVAFSYDGNVLASRGGDDTLKLWDIRQFNRPLFSASGLPTMFPMTDCCFSPDDKLIVTGTSVQRGCGSGKLVFFERRTFQRVYEIDITDASVVRCLWHPKLNQIMVGTGNGLAKVYYDPNKSQRGAKLCVVKTQRKAKQAETLTQDYIITPHALPMFREPRQRSTRKQLEKDRLDPLKSHKPEPPVAGPGRGGRVGTHGGTLSSYIVKNIALDKTDDSNPREAILRHAKAAEDNPYWVSPAYSKTQPKTMFAQVESDDEEAKNEPEWKKRKI